MFSHVILFQLDSEFQPSLLMFQVLLSKIVTNITWLCVSNLIFRG